MYLNISLQKYHSNDANNSSKNHLKIRREREERETSTWKQIKQSTAFDKA